MQFLVTTLSDWLFIPLIICPSVIAVDQILSKTNNAVLVTTLSDWLFIRLFIHSTDVLSVRHRGSLEVRCQMANPFNFRAFVAFCRSSRSHFIIGLFFIFCIAVLLVRCKRNISLKADLTEASWYLGQQHILDSLFTTSAMDASDEPCEWMNRCCCVCAFYRRSYGVSEAWKAFFQYSKNCSEQCKRLGFTDKTVAHQFLISMSHGCWKLCRKKFLHSTRHHGCPYADVFLASLAAAQPVTTTVSTLHRSKSTKGHWPRGRKRVSLCTCQRIRC